MTTYIAAQARKATLPMALLALCVAVPAALMMVGGEQWWRYMIPRHSPMAHIQAAAFVVCAISALVHASRPSHRLHQAAWSVASLCFLALAVVERSSLHNNLSAPVAAFFEQLRPDASSTHTASMCVAAIGAVAFSATGWLIRRDSRAVTFFCVSVALGVVTAYLDSNGSQLTAFATRYAIETLEESIELAAIIAMAAACVVALLTPAKTATINVSADLLSHSGAN